MFKFFNSTYAKLTGDLFNVIEEDDVETLSEMVKNKNAADKFCRNGCYLLYNLCSRDAFKCLIWLLKIGADPNITNINPLPWTPLRFAVENNLQDLIRLLIMHGVNPDKPEPNSSYATPRNMANAEMKKIISETEQGYQSLLSLKAEYETLKAQADAAYKKPNMKEAKQLYQAAAEKYEGISKIWGKLYEQEENEVLKSYYQEQQQCYLMGVSTLKHAVNTETHSTFIKNREGNPSQIRQRKIYQQKQQQIPEEQLNQHKLVM